MDVATLYVVLAIISVSSTASAQEGTCNACNCQFNNVEVLNQLIESKIATGVIYTRWGKSSCPTSTGAQLVYAGRTGGTHYNTRGGAAEKICLPEDPEYIAETSGISLQYYSTVQGGEYEVSFGPNANVIQHNAPCAVCYVPTRATTIMIPAKTSCPSSWTREYYGYLMTERDNHQRSSYNCVDNNPDVVAGTEGDEDPSLFDYTITDCNGLPCPPYENRRILSCAVCTK